MYVDVLTITIKYLKRLETCDTKNVYNTGQIIGSRVSFFIKNDYKNLILIKINLTITCIYNTIDSYRKVLINVAEQHKGLLLARLDTIKNNLEEY